MVTLEYTDTVAQLLAYGDPREETEWPDYLSLGFTEEHVPELVKMALDEDFNRASSESLEVWAPVHAWRALGQLKAEQAIEPLMALFDYSEDFDDDWVLSEFPTVYGMIGPKAIPALAEYLSDTSAELMSRISVVDCINQIGKTNPNAKPECAQALSVQLDLFNDNPPPLNGFLINGLVHLAAVDCLPLIRQAFNNKRVDLTIVGDIEDVEIDLGLRKERSTPRPRYFPVEQQVASTLESGKSNQETQQLKIGRNDPCPCGSGRKYKKCCLNK